MSRRIKHNKRQVLVKLRSRRANCVLMRACVVPVSCCVESVKETDVYVHLRFEFGPLCCCPVSLWWDFSLFEQRWRWFGLKCLRVLFTTGAKMLQLLQWGVAVFICCGEQWANTRVKVLPLPVDQRFHHHFLLWDSVTTETASGYKQPDEFGWLVLFSIFTLTSSWKSIIRKSLEIFFSCLIWRSFGSWFMHFILKSP